ncbi:hypothetical protein OG689_06205 [Kitasatospora sp. NBC_00240]|uniref:hypothetical protein n=1 Tax=Kitasatospora sp. NBC_00240 TaxID=2903567 RepID=UPI0022544C32|nr:hypothetical protein [Kitasatospora sp. NBC_00240]MCX5208887.1 hypothetical protein [Kitasatospora sp. NBC_00240]
MRDPLEWRAGDGPLAAWLELVGERLAGPQPDGYVVRGDVRWPDQPYGVVLAGGLAPAAVAELLTAEGVDGLYVRTSGGRRFAEPHLEIAPTTEPDLGPDGPGVRILHVTPAGVPAGTVPLVGRIKAPAELAGWLGRLSPLLPGGMPGFEWPGTALAEPLGVTLLRRRDTVLLSLQPLAAAERSGTDAAFRLILGSRADALAGHAGLLGSPAVLEERAPSTVRDLARWLGELAAGWGSGPVPRPGLLAGAAPLPRATRASVRRIEDGEAELMFRRHGRPELWARGPASEVSRWALPLLEPAVHEEAPAGSPRRLTAWLERVGRAVLGGPAAWTVDGLAAPLAAAELAGWLLAHCPGRAVAVDRVGGGGLTLGGTRTPAGWVTVTGRRAR